MTFGIYRLRSLKATSHFTVFMRGMRAKGKFISNNLQYEQRRLSFAGETSSVSLVAFLHIRKTAVWDVALAQRFFVRVSMRSKIPTTFYLQKTARVARIGNYSYASHE